MRRVLIGLLAALAILLALAAGVLWLTGSPVWPHPLSLAPAQGLPKDAVIEVQARPERPQVHQGDVFSYVVEVWYNPARVAEIDLPSLDRGLDLKPFEIRGTGERQFGLNAGTRVLRREYRLQLVDGKVNALLEFPALAVRYRLQNSEGLSERVVVPEPIFVAPRLPADSSKIELRPPTGRLEDPSRRYLPWLLGALAIVVGGMGAADLAWRAIPQWRAARQRGHRLGDADVLVQAYRSLCTAVAAGAEPGRLLYQIEQILRLVLAREQPGVWLADLDPAQAKPEARAAVAALLITLQTRRSADGAERLAEVALTQLDEVLSICFGEEEVKVWRS